MWTSIPLDSSKKYVLELCQDNNGRRFCRVAEALASSSDDFRVFVTEAIPVDLLSPARATEIQRAYKIMGGGAFCFGAHGEWFTDREIASLREYDRGACQAVAWETEQEPWLAPR